MNLKGKKHYYPSIIIVIIHISMHMIIRNVTWVALKYLDTNRFKHCQILCDSPRLEFLSPFDVVMFASNTLLLFNGRYLLHAAVAAIISVPEG